MRLIMLIALLAAVPCGGQDLPDPGRRLSAEEQKADPEKRRPPAKDERRSGRPRDAAACERARIYYQSVCQAPDSRGSRGMECAEAYALYRQSCD